jgi:hypothetical protein
MNKEQLKLVRDMLELDNLALGKALGLTCTTYQCRQIDNLINGKTPEIKRVIVLAIECLARQQYKLSEFKNIMKV